MKTFNVLRSIAALLLFFLLCTAYDARAEALAPDLAAALGALGPDDELSVIVTLSDRADLTTLKDKSKGVRRSKVIKALRARAMTAQKPLRDMLEKEKGVKKIRPLWISNAVAFTATTKIIKKLLQHPGIERIALDQVVNPPITTTGIGALPEWNISLIKAPELWNLGYRGQGTVIASMDTGVDAEHPDLGTKWRGGGNSWYDPNGEHAAPYDAHGHGTQTMGIMVGGDGGGSAIGVAPEARWIAVKIFNDAGTSTYSIIHQGFQWLLDPDGNPDTDDAPDIVNHSWALVAADVCIPEFQPDIAALKAANIAVVFAGGNYGPNPSTSVSPANNAGSVSVGAVDQSLTAAYFSSRGPSACDGGIFPHLTAPGVNIRTTDLSFGGLPLYTYADGTSFAAPHIAGAAALLLQALPDLAVADLELALKTSAQDLGEPGADNNYGYGLVDIYGAYAAIVPVVPVANNDSYSTNANAVLNVPAPGVLGNDAGTGITAVLVTNPGNGAVTLNADGSFAYTPNTGFSGADSFTYSVTDGVQTSAPATVTIDVIGPTTRLYLSLEANQTIGGVAYANEDIVAFNSNNQFSMLFDGSDVGVGALNMDAFHIVDATHILMSFSTAAAIPGIAGIVDDSDIVMFTATQLGATTTGTFSLFFDGSDVGLTTSTENVDAIDLLPDGRLLISTNGRFFVPGLSGQDADLIACTGTFGPATTCTWTMYFDGSDVGLSALGGEDIDGAAVGADGKVYLSTLGGFGVPGVAGANEDGFVCTPNSLGNTTSCTYSPFFDGSLYGLGANNVDAIDVP